jgi:hypothetical protein
MHSDYPARPTKQLEIELLALPQNPAACDCLLGGLANGCQEAGVNEKKRGVQKVGYLYQKSCQRCEPLK